MALIDQVRGVLNRLAPHGWHKLLKDVTGGDLDITARDLRSELSRNLRSINRRVNGFQDFAEEAARAIEPGKPAFSLLYHALAHPAVTAGANGAPLTAFPTLAEMEAVENYVFGIQPFPLSAARPRANSGAPLAVVVFSCEYRPAQDTVHQKHADLCFSRIGVARAGTAPPLYNEARRHFEPLVENDLHAFRVMPSRYVVYLASRRKGDHRVFGPMRFQPGDEEREFWVPVHKLFGGTECIEGLDLHVTMESHHVNQKLRKIHQVLNAEGYDSGWREPDISRPPFVITENIAGFSRNPKDGPGLLVPEPHESLVEAATYRNKPLSFNLLKNYHTASRGVLTTLASSLWFSPRHNSRPAPEFVNIRHQLLPGGRKVNLNDQSDLDDRIREGGWSCLHFVDYSADGWISARIPQLLPHVHRCVSAYSLVTPPSFFPFANQRELTDWTSNVMPASLAKGLWIIPPRVLSDRRYAGNIELKGSGFEIQDDTVPAIVSMPYVQPSAQRPLNADEILRPSMLPDASAGYFDPGWDTTINHDVEQKTYFLENYGLGSPFLEDAKLCAAFGNFWPAVAPDAAREFQPLQGWPTVTPLTDEEIGLDGGTAWDGVTGPKLVTHQGQEMVRYADFDHTDYIDKAAGRLLTSFFTSRIDADEYERRVLAMGWVYSALGIDNEEYFKKYKTAEDALVKITAAKARWAVLSFKKISSEDRELKDAERKARVNMDGPVRYRFQVYRHGRQVLDKKDCHVRYVEVHDMTVLFTDLLTILMKTEKGPWTVKHIPLANA